jgi:nodulation protein E
MTRVAITGMGAVSALGIGVEALWSGLMAARSGVRRITLFDPTTLTSPIAAEVPDFDPRQWIPPDKIDKIDAMDRFSQFAVAAAGEALRAAGLSATDLSGAHAGVAVGSAVGGALTEDDQYLRLYGERHLRLHPLTIPRLMNAAAAAQLSMCYGADGPALSFGTACAAGTHAIGEAAEIIRAGRADIMLAGGADAPIAYGVMKAWEAMRVMAPAPADGPARACRPFSRDRQGLVIGEGAGIVVLEEWERARARGADILAELAGYGATADAGHLTQPGIDAPARAMTLALAQASLSPNRIDYINAHGTATRLNDATETAIIKRVFGASASRVAISSTKSMHGHAMGASGALELIATVLALRRSVAPPTANYNDPDPECDLDYVPNEARPLRIRAALSNSFGFGGLNAVLAIVEPK